ncbi:MAG: beta-propeller domain-containing protein [Candidatus Bathyarchaeota archaeon]|nr:beta-propeller domain-containing protein [Candidatus Bathyarchaeota archaeon]
MEKEIKKRAYVYGFAAVLLAILLGSLCYNLGVNPQYEEPTQPTPPSPEPSPTPSLTALKTFSSLDELRSFLSNSSAFIFYGPFDFEILGVYPLGPEVRTANVEYSTTNVQVAGVDEADIIKTDGEYIYVVSGNNISILRSYPTDQAELVSKIIYNDTYPVGIFVSQNHDRLAVLGCEYFIPLRLPYWYDFFYDYYCLNIRTFIDLYDISNKTNPIAIKNFTISGSYFNSRMIGDYVYFVVSQPAYIINETVILPKIYTKEGIKEIGATEIYYHNASDNYYLYTTIVAFNMQNVTEEATYKTIMLNGASCMYVSLNNVYITFPETYKKTTIYRIRIENNTITPEAVGSVLGYPLNQFSMDEYNGYFRIATNAWVNGNIQNNVFILDMNLDIAGSLENITLAFNERMDSARFIGDRCYLATSVVQRDPFFVIDVGNVSEPKVLGYLKIPGFTQYLHPYDENHIIGLGMDGSNVKISIYDVSNVTAPKNITEYKIEGYRSYTLALTEHKAFLFDKAKEFLVIPVTVYYQDYSSWYGVYVFKINLEVGIVLRGNVTHQENDAYYFITRALYIENVLYTVSNIKVQMNSLENLELIREVKLN